MGEIKYYWYKPNNPQAAEDERKKRRWHESDNNREGKSYEMKMPEKETNKYPNGGHISERQCCFTFDFRPPVAPSYSVANVEKNENTQGQDQQQPQLQKTTD